MNGSTKRSQAGVRPASRQPVLGRMAVAAMLAAWSCGSSGAGTLPTGMTVVSGQAQTSQTANGLTIFNSPNAILNWNSFSIGAGNSVRFEQASASSQVLNRVVGNDPSSILGSLSSNGRVWLINPNGVLFGQGARVDVAGLVTSTLNLNDIDWLGGNYRFGRGSADPASIVNEGQIRTSLGGSVMLLGAEVVNRGTVEAPGGQVLVAAGDSIELLDSGAPNVGVRVAVKAGQVLNLGTLAASGGQIDIHAASVNQQGLVRADALEAGSGGRIVLRASDDLLVSGRVDASAQAGQGGQVSLLGRQVGLLAGASVDVSGATGGGQALVGGGAQGKDASVPNAEAVYIAPQAMLNADATGLGNGGRLIVWSDQATRAFGSFSARGGALGGDGGFVETSGGYLDARPSFIDVSARRGAAGNWLLDPFNFTVTDNAIDLGFDFSFSAIGNNATMASATLLAALNAGTNVTLTTGNGGAQAGDITFSGANISVTALTPGSLTLIADRDIVFTNSNLHSSLGAMPLTMQAGRAGSGAISLRNTSIMLAGGNINLTGFGTALDANGGSHAAASAGPAGLFGVEISGVSLETFNGSVNIAGASQSANSIGVYVDGSSLVKGSQVAIVGDGGAGRGVVVSGSVDAGSSLDLRGRGQTGGIALMDFASLQAQTASLSGRSTGNGYGVMFSSPNGEGSMLYGLSGALNIMGANAGGGPAVLLIGNSGAPQDLIDAQGGTTAVLTAAPGSGGMFVQSTGIHMPSGGLTLNGAGSLQMSQAFTQGTGALRLRADSISLSNGTQLRSDAGGDAITLASSSDAGLSSFTNAAGASALQTSAGRWIVFGHDITDVANFQPGGLVHDFKRYGGAFGSWAGDSGNGLVFEVSQLATVTLTVQPKVYDGSTLASFVGGSATGVLGDSGVLSGTAVLNFNNPNAGALKPVILSGNDPVSMHDAQGKPVYGYGVTSNLFGDITPKTISGSVLAANKVYNGNLIGSANVTALTGLVGTQTVNVTATANFLDKNVGNAKPVSLVYQVQDGANGGLAANYSFSGPASSSADITPATLVVQGLSVNNKVYDATVQATLNGAPFVTAFGTDVVSLSGLASASFVDKNVGQNKPINLSGLVLAGADAGNYLLQPVGNVTASITPLALTVSGLVAQNKTYNGNTAATLTGTAQFTPLAGDQVTVQGAFSGSFADKQVGTSKPVTLTGGVLGGADAGNYTLQLAGALSADILPAALLVSGVSAQSKAYDGTTTVTFLGQPTVTAFGNDQVSLVGQPFGAFVDRNIGIGKSVSLGGLVLAGADGGNYTLAYPALFADITPMILYITGLTAASKVYDAGLGTTLTGTPAYAALPGEQVVLGGVAIGNFMDKNVGQNKPIVLSGLTLSGANAGNYVVKAAPSLVASITPAPLQVTGVGALSRVYNTTTGVSLTGSPVIAALGGDQLSLGGQLQAVFADKNAGVNKLVLTSGLTLGGADAGNYTLLQPVVRATITPAPLAVTGVTANDKVYDATTTTTLSGQRLFTPLGNDQVTVSGGVGIFADKNVGNAKPVTSGGFVLGGADGGNYTAVGQSTLSASITPATLRYLVDPLIMFSDDPLPVLSGSVVGFFGGDNVANSTTGTLRFSLSAEGGLVPGINAVVGSGLQSSNYVFIQDVSNVKALTVGGPRPTANLTSDATASLSLSLQSLGSQQQGSKDPASAGLLDTTQPPASAVASPDAIAAQAGRFAAVNVGAMTQDALASLLAARERYMKNLFAQASARLAQDPKLADVGECQRIEDAQAGTCLIGETMKREMQAAAQRLTVPEGAVVSAPPTPAPGPAAAPAPTPAQAAAPKPAAPAVVAKAAPTPLAIRRKVTTAALPQIERKVAVFIGVNSYSDSSIPQLSNAVGDARAVAAMFESALGYETVVVENASKQAVVTTLNKLALEMGPRDSVVVYYAGHGELVEATGQGYWQLSDSDAKRPETWLSNTDIARAIANIGASQVALISDSCYSGSLVSDERVRVMAGKPDPAQLLARKSVVVMSSGGNEPVSDEGKQGHSPFAWSLMNTLKQVSNWQVGGNVFERVRFAVAREMPQRPRYGASASAGHQTGGDYLFEQRQLEAAQSPKP
ncbi:YDG domain-containing protein [Pelomonas sp. SE-A7]|uniref:YDG domain-containing protein n=1 Tax=Pelomonas sp. SE-A7 TaxID=3054953 RepID=UPI00259CB057|nr:YDG domain-containing protein [Pelomonas sp. SE-A7]MDM4764733.1 YDG domain-containing protein [Pelomonas sp. SE-A7]